MRSSLPLRDDLPIEPERPGSDRLLARWTTTWGNWFNAVQRALAGWSKSITGTKTHDFGSINGGAEGSTTVTVLGARTTDTPDVHVTPSANVAGIIFTGVVTADDTVTLYAKNFTSGAIDPASLTFRVTVLQP